MRRYEILLPLRFNDGSAVPDDLVGAMPFRCVTDSRRFHSKRKPFGEYGSMKAAFRDDLARVFVDVPETPDDRAWFIAFKERLKREFQQLDIWIVTYPIEVL